MGKISGWKIALLLALITLSALEVNWITAQELPPVDVEFISRPPNAEIEVNGKSVGRSPLKIKLVPGRYSFKVSRRNFETWQEQQIVTNDTTIYAPLDAGTRFVITNPEMIELEWLINSNDLAFVRTQSSASSQVFTYNLKTGMIKENDSAIINTIDFELRQILKLDAPDKRTLNSLAFQSPLKRYIVYVTRPLVGATPTPVPESAPRGTEHRVAIYDTQKKVTYITDIDLYGDSYIKVPFQPVWQSDETLLWIKFAEPTLRAIPEIVLLNETGIQTVILREFTIQPGKKSLRRN